MSGPDSRSGEDGRGSVNPVMAAQARPRPESRDRRSCGSVADRHGLIMVVKSPGNSTSGWGERCWALGLEPALELQECR